MVGMPLRAHGRVAFPRQKQTDARSAPERDFNPTPGRIIVLQRRFKKQSRATERSSTSSRSWNWESLPFSSPERILQLATVAPKSYTHTRERYLRSLHSFFPVV